MSFADNDSHHGNTNTNTNNNNSTNKNKNASTPPSSSSTTTGCCGSWMIRMGLFWFAAFIPPSNPDVDVDYYAVLGLSNDNQNNSNHESIPKEDIRRAYKKKSLQYHPDKILQRGGNPKEYEDAYLQIQEAHAVLSDDTKRKYYHIMSESSSRYHFIMNEHSSSSGGGGGTMMTGYQHLGSASCEQRSRLMFLGVIMFVFIFIQPILICIKINQELHAAAAAAAAFDGTENDEQTSSFPLEQAYWILILIPWWLWNFFYFIFMTTMTMMIWTTAEDATSWTNAIVWCHYLETIAWIIAQLVIVLKWDALLPDSDQLPYALLSIPIYVAFLCRWTSRYFIMKSCQHDIAKMITIPKLNMILGGGRTYEDLSEEEQDAIGEQYIIVHLPPDANVEMTPEAQAALAMGDDIFVSASPEYKHAEHLYYQSLTSLVLGMVLMIPQMILILLKVDGTVTSPSFSWWLVLIPLWVYWGTQLLYNCYSCCCTVVGDEIVMDGQDDDDDDDDDDDEAVAVDDEEEQRRRRSEQENGFVSANASMSTSFPLPPADLAAAQAEMENNNDNITVTPATDKAKKTTTTTTTTTMPTSPTSSTTDKDKQNKNSAVSPTTMDIQQIKFDDNNNTSMEKNDVENNNNNNSGHDENSKDEEDPVFMDEETFREFKEAYDEAQGKAMEAQAKAAGNVCILLFQILMTCLVVGKLEQANVPRIVDENDVLGNDDVNNIGFNTIWIIFPFLFIAGCMLCCWGCFLYTAGNDGLDNLVNQATATNGDADDETSPNKQNHTTTQQQEQQQGDEEAPHIVMIPNEDDTHDNNTTNTYKPSSTLSPSAAGAGVIVSQNNMNNLSVVDVISKDEAEIYQDDNDKDEDMNDLD